MPTQVDVPIGIGSRDDWFLEGSPSKLAAVAGNDGDSGIIFANSGGREFVQLFRFPVLVGVTDPVTSATLHTYARQYDAGIGTRIFYLWWNGVQAGSNWGEYYNVNYPSYILDGVHTVSGPGPALSAVNGEHGFHMRGSGGPDHKWELWLTLFWRTVTYDYAAGTAGNEFAHLIGSIAAAIGANLLMRDMPALARTVQAKTRTLILPGEYAEALAAWKRERHVHLVAV